MVGRIRTKKLAVSKRSNYVVLINESAPKHAIQSFPTVSDSVESSRIQNLSQISKLLMKQMRRGGNPEEPTCGEKSLRKLVETDASKILFSGA